MDAHLEAYWDNLLQVIYESYMESGAYYDTSPEDYQELWLRENGHNI